MTVTKRLIPVCMALSLLLSVSCRKGFEPFPSHRAEAGEIVFSADGVSSPSSKATVVTSMSSFYVYAATGTPGSQSNYWCSQVTATKSGDVYQTGKYWARTNPSITSFYACNVSMGPWAAGGAYVYLNNCNTDVICAHLANPTFNASNSLTFNHILARVRYVNLNTQTGYTLSDVSGRIRSVVTSGSYNLRTGNWSSLGSGTNTDLATFTNNLSAKMSTNDIWLIPGTYTIDFNYTLTKGDYSESFSKSATVTLVAGRMNDIGAVAVGGNAGDITLSVSITDWQDGEEINAVL